MRGMILAGTFCVLSTIAFADPPKVGETMKAESSILCDTKQQVLDLYAGTKVDNGKGIVPIYLKYRQMIDKDGEPTCNMQPIVGPTVKSIEDLGESHGYIGNTVHGWLIEITGENGHAGWALYGEEIKAAEPKTDI
jgi:hypothetical protein